MSSAGRRLHEAITALAADGLRPPCGELDAHHLWLSDLAAERRVAVQLCGPCPVRKACGAAAAERREQFGVWGGRDRSPKTATTTDPPGPGEANLVPENTTRKESAA